MKFAIIGLDGADFDLIQQFDMPNLKAVMKKGSYGKLRSTLPPITAPAWSSIITGKDPSWHGVMHFVDTDPFHGKKQLISSRSIKCKKIWQILNKRRVSCGIYTVPITYPVEKLDGFMVTGMLTPGERAFTFPPMDVKIKPFVEWQSNQDTNSFFNSLITNTNNKFNSLKQLIKQFNVDFLFMVENNTDSIQHRFFHEVGLEKNRVRAVGKFFSFVDEKIGELLDILDCPVLFVSDHGFGKYPTKWVNGNIWLREKGLLNYTGNQIDWKNTKTYFYRAWLNCGFIKNNINNISNINNINNISSIADDLKKEEWVKEIYLSNDIYDGPFAKDAPDIIFVFADDYTGNVKVGNFDIIEDIPVFSRWTGHKMDGFWACSEKIELHNLTDVAPTVLKFMGMDDAIDELGDPIDFIPESVKKTIKPKKM